MTSVYKFHRLEKSLSQGLFPRINQLVDATTGHQLPSFMDAYLGYNQIKMHPLNQDYTSFIINMRLYYYKVMPFDLKNIEATYKRLVNRMFV